MDLGSHQQSTWTAWSNIRWWDFLSTIKFRLCCQYELGSTSTVSHRSRHGLGHQRQHSFRFCSRMCSREDSWWPCSFVAIMDGFWDICGIRSQCRCLQRKYPTLCPFLTLTSCEQLENEAWRWQLSGPMVPTVPLLLMVYLCPESPPFMIKNNNRYDHAFRSLCKLRNTELQAAKEVYSAFLQQRARSKLPATKASLPTKILELFTIPRIRRATTAAYVVQLSQQLCGINIIAFYSSTVCIFPCLQICATVGV